MEPISGVTSQLPMPNETQTFALEDLQPLARSNSNASIADDLISNVKSMHNSFKAEVSRIETSKAERVGATKEAEQLELLAVSMENAARMQAQLVQFSLLSSVTTSFGEKLNSFLRGS